MKPILLALDLILLRWRTGALVFEDIVSEIKNIGDLPIEIIEMIKSQVSSTYEVKEEAQECLDLTSCDKVVHMAYDDENDDSCDLQKNELGSKWSEVRCGTCNSCYGRVVMLVSKSSLKSKRINIFLKPYNLVVSSTNTFNADNDQDSGDLNELFSTVSIPISPSTLQSCTGSNNFYPTSSSVIGFDITTIDIIDAAPRFKRFLRDWKLQTYNGSIGGIRERNCDFSVISREGDSIEIQPRLLMWNESTYAR